MGACARSLVSPLLSAPLHSVLPVCVLLISVCADLRFSNRLDPQSVIDARAIELQQMQLWIKQFAANTVGASAEEKRPLAHMDEQDETHTLNVSAKQDGTLAAIMLE